MTVAEPAAASLLEHGYGPDASSGPTDVGRGVTSNIGRRMGDWTKEKMFEPRTREVARCEAE